MAGIFGIIAKAISFIKGLSLGTKILYAAAALSTTYQVYQARVARKELEDQRQTAAAQELRISPSGQPIPVIYGFSYTGGNFVFADISDKLTVVPAPSAAVKGSLVAKARGEKSEFLLMQHVISAGQIDGLINVWFNSENIHGDDVEEAPLKDVSICELTTTGVASAMATAFCSSDMTVGNGTGNRTDTAKFAKLSYITSVARLDVSNPKFSRRPVLDIYIKGRTLKSISESSGEYELSSSETFARTVPLVLLDYLTADSYGPGLDIDDIDLQSFYEANVIASRSVTPGASLQESAGIPAGEATSFQRYVYDGHVQTNEEHGKAILRILEHAPGAMFYPSASGKYKLSLPDSTMTAVQAAVGIIDEEILLDPVEIVYPSEEIKINRINASFSNVEKNYARDSIIYPEIGSAQESTFFSEDNDILLEENVQLSGVIDKYHASSICHDRIMMSRRELYRFSVSYSGSLYEPGDVVQLIDNVQLIDEYVRIQKVKPFEDGSIEFEAIKFSPDDYSWYSGSASTDVETVSADSNKLSKPSNLRLAKNLGKRESALTWNHPDTQHNLAEGYEIQTQIEIDDNIAVSWATVGTVSKSLSRYKHIVGIFKSAYYYRIRAYGEGAEPSDWVETEIEPIKLTYPHAFIHVDPPLYEHIWTQTKKTVRTP